MPLSDPVVIALSVMASAVITGAMSVVAIVINTRSAQAAKEKEIEAAKQETIRKEAREDALAARVAAAAEAVRVEAALARNDIKAVAVQIDGLLAQRDKDRRQEGREEQKVVSDKNAEALAQGQQEGRELERERANSTQAAIGPAPGGPVPVADDRAAEIALRGVEAQERSADAAEAVAPAKSK